MSLFSGIHEAYFAPNSDLIICLYMYNIKKTMFFFIQMIIYYVYI